MKRKSVIIFVLSWVAFVLVACNLPGVGSSGEPPSVVLNAPAAGSEFEVGEEVPVQSTSTDDEGVARVELRVNGQVVRSDNTPEGDMMGLFALVQPWVPNTPGSFNVEVIAYDEEENASSPAAISINVIEAAPEEEVEEEAPEPCVARSNTDLNVRTGPGTNNSIVGILQLGQTAPVTGRDTATTWYQIEFAGAPGNAGWVSAPFVSLMGDCGEIPVTGTASGGGNTGGGVQHTATPTTATGATPTATATTGGGTGAADIQVSSISMPTSFALDSSDQATVTITVTIINNGGVDASSATEVVLYPLGGSSPAISMGSATLTAGESRSFVTDYTYTATGTYSVRATAGSSSSTLSVTVNAYDPGATATPTPTPTYTPTPTNTPDGPVVVPLPDDLVNPELLITIEIPELELAP